MIREKIVQSIESAGITLSNSERHTIEIVDFGLGNLEKEGAQIATLVSTDKVALKAIYLMPYQIEPEHWHPTIGDYEGKEETLRCVSGMVIVGVEGVDSYVDDTSKYFPAYNQEYYSCKKLIVLHPGDQIYFSPGARHWFRAWDVPCVLFSISSTVVDAKDQFTNPHIVR